MHGFKELPGIWWQHDDVQSIASEARVSPD